MFFSNLNICYSAVVMITLCLVRALSAQSLEFLTREGLKHSPVLRSYSLERQRSKKLHARESIFTENPKFSYGYQNIPTSSAPSKSALGEYPMSGISLGLSQKLAFPWESSTRKDIFWNKYLSFQEKEKEARRNFIRQIELLYHRLHFQYKKRNIIQSSKKSLGSIVKLARTLVSVSKMSVANLLKVEADFSILENQLLEIEAEIGRLQAQLEGICGLKIKWKKNDGKRWLVKSKNIRIPEHWNKKKHPLFKALSFASAEAQAHYSHEKAKIFPGFTLEGTYIERTSIPGKDAGENFYTLRLSIPIPLYYPLKERHSIAAAEEGWQSAKEKQREVELKLEALWKGEKQKAHKLLGAYQNYEKEILPKYLAAYKAHLLSLVSTKVNLLDVLDTYRQYLNVSIKEAELYLNLRESILMLNYLARGSSTKENKNVQN